jgi:hypothetical protein
MPYKIYLMSILKFRLITPTIWCFVVSLSFVQADEFIELNSESPKISISVKSSEIVQVEDRGDRVVVVTRANILVLKGKPDRNISFIGNALGFKNSTMLYEMLLHKIRFASPDLEIKRRQELQRRQRAYEDIKDQINPILEKVKQGIEPDQKSRFTLISAYSYLLALESAFSLDFDSVESSSAGAR